MNGNECEVTLVLEEVGGKFGRKNDIFAVSQEANNGSMVHIAHPASLCSLTGVTLHSAQTPSVVLPSSPVHTGRKQSMGVGSGVRVTCP